MTLKIKKGDNVEVLSGKDKGKRGKVIKILSAGAKAVVEGLNVRKKTMRRAQRGGQKGSIIDVFSPMPISKIALVCPECGKRTRVGFRLSAESKLRFCRKCNQEFK